MNQPSLFARAPDADPWQRLPMADADVRLWADFLPAHQSAFTALCEQLAWRSERIRLFGREHWLPRLTAWHGDPDAVYRYSGLRLVPEPWTPLLSNLRREVERACEAPFNSVLANWYRDGDDAMGRHSDDERDLGRRPVIASLSLGATRRFSLQHKRRDQAPVRLELQGGSLLVMAGETQQFWQHWLPRTRRAVAGRINLTFRQVWPASAGAAGA